MDTGKMDIGAMDRGTMDTGRMDRGARERDGTYRDETELAAGVPLWFWIAGAACLVWNLLGAADYLLNRLHDPAYMAQMPPGLVAFLGALPGWVAGAWALGVWGSLAGSVLLLARVRHAAVAYALSFAGAVGSLTWQYAHGALAMAGGRFTLIAVLVLGAILAQLWLSRAMFWRGVLH